MRKRLAYILVIGLLLFGLLALDSCTRMQAKADTQELDYHALYEAQQGTSLTGLAQAGWKHIYTCPDSALAYFNMVAARYNPKASAYDQYLYAYSFNQIGYIYLFHYANYQQAYEYLLRARDICEEMLPDIPDWTKAWQRDDCQDQTGNHDEKNRLADENERFLRLLPEIYFNIGNVLCLCEDISNGMEYYEKAFYGSIDINDPVITLSAFSSLASEALENKTLQQYDAILSTFKKLKIPDNTQNKAYYYQFLLALDAIRQADFPTAWQAFDRMEALTDTTKTLEKRFHVFTLLNKNLCYEMAGEYDSAIWTALKIEKIIPLSDPGLYDFAMANFFSLSDYYSRKGEENISLLYLKKGLAISDSILNSKKLSQIHEMKTNYEIGRMNDHIRNVEHKRQIQLVILYMVLAILGMIAAFLTWVIRQNKALRQKNQDLFAKNEALLRQEEFFREFREQNAENRTPCNEQTTGNQSIERNTHHPEKYIGSSLDSHQKADISNRLRNVMEQNPTIYSSDFSLEKLADLVDCNPKYVSQVINELLGKNFNAFVAEYRVKEACRRITDTEHYGHLTLEAIANSLGFMSRGNFNSVFKRVTGLTPTEYRKLGLQQERMQDRS